ncbi:unnamed protein product [Cylicostephanus goldi]|uniref:Uncharacterized protein n=1 Tax=Cylicostephanus goldi TaxID=71465 RepID=A0A3P6QNA0_CYLGO|nr:unnamed protein product [Cylicostephanus goldi]
MSVLCFRERKVSSKVRFTINELFSRNNFIISSLCNSIRKNIVVALQIPLFRDGVVFIGLCVTCAGILLMVIKLCYNYTRNFPVRKDSELSTVLTTNAFTPKHSHDAVRHSVA